MSSTIAKQIDRSQQEERKSSSCSACTGKDCTCGADCKCGPDCRCEKCPGSKQPQSTKNYNCDLCETACTCGSDCRCGKSCTCPQCPGAQTKAAQPQKAGESEISEAKGVNAQLPRA